MGEWLEADGLGGFASGTVDGIRTRRYQAVLLTATSPPTGRVVLVNGFEAWLETPAGSVALTSQRYAPDVVHPDGASRIETFTPDPWPSWMLGLPDGNRIEHQVLVPRGQAATVLTWRLRAGPGGTLAVRPLALRPGLPRAPSREPRLPLRRGRRGSARRLASLSRPARDRGALERQLRAPAGLVPELPLHRGASARARLRRGPGITRDLSLGPGARRGGPDPRSGGARARGRRRGDSRRGR